eukprot:2226147-Rhodomonas_salina.1
MAKELEYARGKLLELCKQVRVVVTVGDTVGDTEIGPRNRVVFARVEGHSGSLARNRVVYAAFGAESGSLTGIWGQAMAHKQEALEAAEKLAE